MKVRCVFTTMNDAQRQELALNPFQQMDQRGSLTVGKEYLVLGLEFEVDPAGFETGTYVWIVPDVGYVVRFRLLYFEITDPQVSRYWQAQSLSAGNVTLFPPSFYRENYLKELIEDRVPEVDEDFFQVLTLLQLESESR